MVKRVLAIVNLVIFLLNVLGYYGILSSMKEVSGKRLSNKLDTEMYDLGGNVTIKMPLALPFEVTSEHFDREGGQFEMDGESFKIIKQRHYNDTLYLVCIRDEQTTRINSVIDEFVQSFTGQDDGDDQHVAPSFSKDYVSLHIALTKMVNGWVKDILSPVSPQFLFDSYFSSIIHPPERSIA